MTGIQQHQIVIEGHLLNGAQVGALLLAVVIAREHYTGNSDIANRLAEIDKILQYG
jgi:hypothetical protein